MKQNNWLPNIKSITKMFKAVAVLQCTCTCSQAKLSHAEPLNRRLNSWIEQVFGNTCVYCVTCHCPRKRDWIWGRGRFIGMSELLRIPPIFLGTLGKYLMKSIGYSRFWWPHKFAALVYQIWLLRRIPGPCVATKWKFGECLEATWTNCSQTSYFKMSFLHLEAVINPKGM